MKHALPLLLIFLFTNFVKAQQDSAVFNVNIDVSKPVYNEIGTAVAAVKMNVLYIGVDNPIDIAVPGAAAKDVSAVISDGILKKISDGHFIAAPTKVGRAIVVVKVKDKEVSRHEFRVKRIADPEVSIDGITRAGSCRAAGIANSKGLQASLNSSDLYDQFVITSYTFIFKPGPNQKSVDVNGPLFTDAVKALIAGAKAGDVIIITNAMAMGPDRQKRMLRDAMFTIF